MIGTSVEISCRGNHFQNTKFSKMSSNFLNCLNAWLSRKYQQTLFYPHRHSRYPQCCYTLISLDPCLFPLPVSAVPASSAGAGSRASSRPRPYGDPYSEMDYEELASVLSDWDMDENVRNIIYGGSTAPSSVVFKVRLTPAPSILDYKLVSKRCNFLLTSNCQSCFVINCLL